MDLCSFRLTTDTCVCVALFRLFRPGPVVVVPAPRNGVRQRWQTDVCVKVHFYVWIFRRQREAMWWCTNCEASVCVCVCVCVLVFMVWSYCSIMAGLYGLHRTDDRAFTERVHVLKGRSNLVLVYFMESQYRSTQCWAELSRSLTKFIYRCLSCWVVLNHV